MEPAGPVCAECVINGTSMSSTIKTLLGGSKLQYAWYTCMFRAGDLPPNTESSFSVDETHWQEAEAVFLDIAFVLFRLFVGLT